VVSKTKQEFVIRPEDRAFCVLSAAVDLVKQMLSSGVRVSVVISKWAPAKTPPQHRTVFMWNGEVAAQLTVMGALAGSNVVWKTDDAHEMIFKRLCMPSVERMLPGGEVFTRPIGLSDKEATREVVSAAMERYQVWAIEHGIELTQPADHDDGRGFR
jgi:hypothetical protein